MELFDIIDFVCIILRPVAYFFPAENQILKNGENIKLTLNKN